MDSYPGPRQEAAVMPVKKKYRTKFIRVGILYPRCRHCGVICANRQSMEDHEYFCEARQDKIVNRKQSVVISDGGFAVRIGAEVWDG